MDNYEKRDRYAYLSNKLKNALDNEFYYEAILLEYAIIDDRTSSLLRHSNFNLKNLKKNDVYNRISVLKTDKLFDNEYCKRYLTDEFLDRLDMWRRDRNNVIHNLVESNYDENQIKAFALDGNAIVSHLGSKSKNINNYFDKLNLGK